MTPSAYQLTSLVDSVRLYGLLSKTITPAIRPRPVHSWIQPTVPGPTRFSRECDTASFHAVR